MSNSEKNPHAHIINLDHAYENFGYEYKVLDLTPEQLDYIAEKVTNNLQAQVDKQIKSYLRRHYEDDLK